MQIQAASKRPLKGHIPYSPALEKPIFSSFSLSSMFYCHGCFLPVGLCVLCLPANQQPSFYCHASAANKQGAASESCVFARLGVYKGAETVTCWLGGARVVADGGFGCGEATHTYSHHTLARTMGLT